MSIWRRKRRYEENRRFSERADDALLAIGILRNSAEGLDTSRGEEEIRQMLSNGFKLLQELASALHQPEQADDYSIVLANELCELWAIVPSDAYDRLREDADIVAAVEEDLSVKNGIREATQTFEDIEAVAGQISETEAEEMRNDLIN